MSRKPGQVGCFKGTPNYKAVGKKGKPGSESSIWRHSAIMTKSSNFYFPARNYTSAIAHFMPEVAIREKIHRRFR